MRCVELYGPGQVWKDIASILQHPSSLTNEAFATLFVESNMLTNSTGWRAFIPSGDTCTWDENIAIREPEERERGQGQHELYV